jgi:hypothetical protein
MRTLIRFIAARYSINNISGYERDRQAMKIFICIDDTDNLDSKGTGHLADELRLQLENKFQIETTKITRHQLFVHENIPYTSHNSTMCFTAEIKEKHYADIISHSIDFLKERSAEGSDPGLCVAIEERIADKSSLMDFGRRATCSVLTKTEAYQLAETLGIHLSEHGGTGGGIIGALAGIGLRMTGNHGRFRGGHPISDEDQTITPKALCRKYAIDEVRDCVSGRVVDSGMISLEGKVKTILLDGLSVLPVVRTADASWRNLTKDEIKAKYN